MHVVVASRLSLEQYSTVQFTEKRSRMSAVRIDCSGSGSKCSGYVLFSGVGGEPERSGIRWAGTGHGGIGFGSLHRYLRPVRLFREYANLCARAQWEDTVISGLLQRKERD